MNIENFRIGAGSLAIDGVDIGETTPEGMIVTYQPSVHFHKSGRFGNSPVKATFLGAEVTIQITIAETTKENMENVMAGVVNEGGKVKLGGVAGTQIVGKVLTLTPFDGTEPWTFRNAVPSGSVEVAYQVENERVFKSTFTALVDGDVPEDEALAYIS